MLSEKEKAKERWPVELLIGGVNNISHPTGSYSMSLGLFSSKVMASLFSPLETGWDFLSFQPIE